MPELAVLVPTRGRPGNIRRLIAAWDFTNAWDVADLVLAVDADDPRYYEYGAVLDEFLDDTPDDTPSPLKMITFTEWMPMVHKLERTVSQLIVDSSYFALGFAGDDHLPQTIGWAERYLAVLHELGTGMVYGDDGYQGQNLSTEWAVTADAVRALGRMVPAPVEHMYCDNAMMDLFGGAGALRHLPEVRIEHMHPIAGKAESDAQYQRVNHRDQFKRDKLRYEDWRGHTMLTDIQAIRALRPGRPDVRPEKSVQSRLRPGTMPRSVTPRPRGNRMTRLSIPRHFKKVRGATPDEIGVALADFAAQVPSDQAIVEIGVFQGRTALLMAWGARQGNGAHLWGVDLWEKAGNTYAPPFNEEGSRRWAEYNVMALGYNSSITLVHDFSANVARDWVTSPDLVGYGNRQVGLIFIDGDHSKEGALADVELWAPHLAPNAVIALDDYGHPDWPGVAEAVDEMVAEGFLEPIKIFHDHLAVTQLAIRQETPEESAAIVDANLRAAGSEGLHAVTAITSEGVSPSPGWATGEEPGPEPQPNLAEPMPVAEAPPLWFIVHEGELGSVRPGTSTEDLNTGQLRALARARGIRLGPRKDLRESMLQALRDGE